MTKTVRKVTFGNISPDIADFSATNRLDKFRLRSGTARFKAFNFFALIIIEHTLREVSVAISHIGPPHQYWARGSVVRFA